MSTSIHKDLLVAEIHQPFSYEYADATARNGASGFVSGDIGKFARQLDDNSMWMLTATTPTWKRVDGTGTGETNTASNVGTAGVGVYKQKTGVDLEFKKINAGSAKVTVVDDTGNDEVDVDVVTGTTADSVCVGNDSRLSDARTPTSHASSHQHGGSDEVATATPGANAIPKADGSGSLDAWVTHLGLASAAPEDVTKAAAAVGTATDAARADHKHDISTAAASSLDATSTNTEGSATSLARSDHTHEIDETGSVTDIEPDDVASAGTAQGFARKDHVHGIEASTPGQIQIGDSAAEGVATAFARSDHTHALTAPAAPVNVTKAAAATGSSTSPARADHKHDVTTAAPVATGTSNAEGTAESLARSDHVHALSAHASTHLDGGSDEIDVADLGSTSASGADQLVRSDGAGGLAWTSAGTPGTIEPDDAAAEGSASTYSRSDHQHAIAAATPGAVTPGDSAAEGSATSFARSDHQHSAPGFGTPGPIEPDDTAQPGSASTFARSDHQHAISTSTPENIVPGDVAAEGISTDFARADHTHGMQAFASPGTIEPDDAVDEGSAATFARSDHQHAIAAAAPTSVSVGQTSAEGSSTSFSRADHVHGTTGAGTLAGLTKEPTGFPNRTDSVVSFAPSPYRRFTIAPAVTSFDFYVNGVKFTKSSAETVDISNSTGIWYIYYDNTGTLQASVTPWSFGDDKAFVALIYWNTAALTQSVWGDERHGIVMDWRTHEYLHTVEQARYVSGFSISGYTLSTDTDAAVQYGLANGVIADEDIIMSIVHAATPTNPFEQVLSDPAEIPVMYRDGSGGAWLKDAATTFPFKNTASGRVNWNQDVSGTWQQTEATNLYYVAYWVFATNDPDEPIISVQGQREDSSLETARANNGFNSLSLGTLPSPEWKLLYRVIYRTSTGYGGTRKARVEAVDDFRTAAVQPGAATAVTSHSSLSDLGVGNDHPQYQLRSEKSQASGYASLDGTTKVPIAELPTGTPGTIQPDDTAAEGSATSVARSDHTHAIVAATPGDVTPGATAAEGSATSFARSDHVHGLGTDYQSSVVTSRTTTTSGTPQVKTSITTPTLTGTYRLGCSMLVDANNKPISVDVYDLTNTTVLWSAIVKPSTTELRVPVTSFLNLSFSSQARTLQLRWYAYSSGDLVGASEARLEFWRVS